MISKEGILETIASGLLISALFMLLLIGCDKRKPMDTEELNEEQTAALVDDIFIFLNPPQINLPTSSAVDTSRVTIAVVDSEGVGVSGVRVSVTRNPQIGYLTAPDTTDTTGVTNILFIAQPGVYGVTNIRVAVNRPDDTLIRTRTLYITGPSDYSLSIDHWPTVPKLIDRYGDPYAINATLVDTTGTGVPGHPVQFSILNNVGRLVDTSSTGDPVTNNEGIVSVLFYNTAADEQDNPPFALLQAVSTTPGDSIIYLAALDTVSLLPVSNTITLEAEDPTVYGDGSDSTTIRAILLDTYGHGIQGDTVRFRNQPFDGSLSGTAVTNQNGIATTAYHPFPGHLGVTRIFSEYRLNTIHQAVDSTDVEILPVRAIGFITVSLQKQNVVADGADSTQLFITVQDSSGGLIADGTTIFLEHTGTGFLTPAQTSTTDGQATSVLRAPANIVGSPDKDSVFVWGRANDTLIVADTAVVTYVPGPVDELVFIRPESTVILIAGSAATETVQVEATDANGNPVANGTQISFRNEIITSTLAPSSSPTMNGIATSIYLVGSGTGDDNVRAFVPHPSNPNDTIWTVQPVVFRCLSSDATTLKLSASQSSIVVGGASCQILATLEDAFGNPLSEGYRVAFQIITANGTQGTSEWPSFRTESGAYHDTIDTNINGQAVTQIYSGTVSGAVSIKACTISDTLFVCDEKSLITISSGPPHTVLVSHNNIAEAAGSNSPERFVQVGAEVIDTFANPVEYGTAVYFTLIPNDVAEVEGNSITGASRLPYHPDSAEGWAFSRVLFGCYAANDSLQVVALSAGDSVTVGDTSQVFVLPIYDPIISLMADPANLWCVDDQCTSTDESDITALLQDGGFCPVENGLIVFSALVAGSIIGPTSVYTDSTGMAETMYQIKGCEIPTPPSQVPQIETTVRAVLFGYPDVEAEVALICSRPQF
ncbi:MAG: Ig-like domain-containing protein [Candidatus Zixiibacteriota bacterium]|nr:MAG: Ig-like domain-containing protein [candidate division Zixibacteria bacterium]